GAGPAARSTRPAGRGPPAAQRGPAGPSGLNATIAAGRTGDLCCEGHRAGLGAAWDHAARRWSMTDDATTRRRQATDHATDQAVKAVVCAVIGITSLVSGLMVARIPSGGDRAQVSVIATISVFMVLTGVTLLVFAVVIWRRRARPLGAEELAFRRARAEFAWGV